MTKNPARTFSLMAQSFARDCTVLGQYLAIIVAARAGVSSKTHKSVKLLHFSSAAYVRTPTTTLHSRSRREIAVRHRHVAIIIDASKPYDRKSSAGEPTPSAVMESVRGRDRCRSCRSAYVVGTGLSPTLTMRGSSRLWRAKNARGWGGAGFGGTAGHRIPYFCHR